MATGPIQEMLRKPAGLNGLTFAKERVLETLRANREEHQTIFNEAVEGYRRTVQREFERRLDDVRNGRNINTHFSLTEPKDQTDDYDNVIAMLEMSEDTEVVLNMNEYSCYMRNQWQWQNQFINTASLYGSATAAANYK